MVGRLLSFAYGLTCWAGFLGLFLYFIAFLGDFWVPKTVNSGPAGPVGQALLINLGLIALFGVHHSVAARPGFKEWFTRAVPKHLERSTYVLISNVLFGVLMWQWQPIPNVIWRVESPAGQAVLFGLFLFGFLLVVFSSFLINHFDLFGVRHVYLNLVGKPYTHPPLKVQSLYKLVRNPLMLGWFIAFWSAPVMTGGRLIFAAGMTLYGVIGILCEERMHRQFLGEAYEAYRKKTPMLLPFPRPNREA